MTTDAGKNIGTYRVKANTKVMAYQVPDATPVVTTGGQGTVIPNFDDWVVTDPSSGLTSVMSNVTFVATYVADEFDGN